MRSIPKLASETNIDSACASKSKACLPSGARRRRQRDPVATFITSEGTFEDGKHLGENDQELALSALYLKAGYKTTELIARLR